MIEEQRCKHEMIIGTCSLCKGMRDDGLYYAAATDSDFRDRRPKVEPVTSGRMIATYDSRCRGGSTVCRRWIKAGDVIVHDTELDTWVCQRCGDWE